MSGLSKTIAPAEAPPASGAGRRGRMLEIDGYRAIAAVMIIVVHAWMQGGDMYDGTPVATTIRGFDAAVSLFFALSGLVTFLPIVRGALTGKVPDGKQFFIRRMYRILPLYFGLVIVVWASRFAGSGQDWSDLIHHLTFTQVYDHNHLFWLDGPSWSLADEMHYYILIALLGPPLARFAARRTTTARKLATMATLPAALLASSLAYTTIAYYGMHISFSDSIAYYNPLARADSFAEGLLLAVVLSIPGVMKARPRVALTLSAIGAAATGVIWIERWHYAPLQVYYFAIVGVFAGCLLTGAAMLHERQLLSRFLRSRLLQLWAATGFSLYLWHEPVMIQLARWHILYFRDPVAWPLSALGLLAAATIVGWLSYKLIEQPGVRLQKLRAELRRRQDHAAPARTGPPPRRLPDVTLAGADGSAVRLGDLLRGRPLLVALDGHGRRRLAEQQFRLDAGEADGVYVSSTPGEQPGGATVLVDRERLLASAINTPAALVEVDPDGLITAVHQEVVA